MVQETLAAGSKTRDTAPWKSRLYRGSLHPHPEPYDHLRHMTRIEHQRGRSPRPVQVGLPEAQQACRGHTHAEDSRHLPWGCYWSCLPYSLVSSLQASSSMGAQLKHGLLPSVPPSLPLLPGPGGACHLQGQTDLTERTAPGLGVHPSVSQLTPGVRER